MTLQPGQKQNVSCRSVVIVLGDLTFTVDLKRGPFDLQCRRVSPV